MTTAQYQRWRVLSRSDSDAALYGLEAGEARLAYLHAATPEHSDHDLSEWTRRLAPALVELLRVAAPDGAVFIEPEREHAHYVKVAADRVLGRERFRNEIVLVDIDGNAGGNDGSDDGGDSGRWRPGHRTLLWYSVSERGYRYNYDAIDRVPYLAPGLVGPEKAARGKTPTDVWWPANTGDGAGDDPAEWRERALRRLVNVHTDPGDMVVECRARSAALARATLAAGRRCVVIPDGADAGCRITLELAEFA